MDNVTEKPTENTEQTTSTESSNSVGDILQRSQEMNSTSKTANSSEGPDTSDITSSVNLDEIKDPVARQVLEKKIKDLEAGYHRKFNEVHQMKKDVESKMESSNTWTQERLDEVLQDPTFNSLVQSRLQNQAPSEYIEQGGSQEQWSALSDSEKQQFENMRRQLQQQDSRLNQILKSQEDAELMNQFPGYDPTVVDRLQSDLLSGRRQATRSDIWKVANFDQAVQNAFELGKKEGSGSIQEKANVINGNNHSEDSVTPEGAPPKEVMDKGYAAVGKWRLSQLIGKNGAK